MMRTFVVAVVLCFVHTFSASFAQTTNEAPKKKPVVAVMVSDDHYDADTLLPPLMERLGKENQWDIVILHGKGGATFSNIDALEKADVLVVYVRRLALPKEQLATVKKFIASGRGLVGLRTASHAFESKAKKLPENAENWPEFDCDILGGNYHDHGKNELGSDVENVASQQDSPILKGVKPERWHSIGSLYYTDPVRDDAKVYQIASSSQQQNLPLTWTRLHKTEDRVTKVAYTGLGHQKDFEVPAFQNLLRNLVNWAAARP